MQPVPTVVLLDEPLAGLDTRSAVSCLRMLRSLPGSHSFVLTIHQPVAEVAALIDRALLLETKTGGCIHVLPSAEDAARLSAWTPSSRRVDGAGAEENSGPRVGPAVQSRADFRGTYASLTTLWFSALYRFPHVELASAIAGLIGGVLIGLMARGSITAARIPMEDAVRTESYTAMPVAGIGFFTSFCIGFFYESREGRLVDHYKAQRILHAGAYLTFHLHRAALLAIMQAAVWMPITVKIAGLPTEHIDEMTLNAAMFAVGWTLLGVVVHQLVSVAFSVHVLMLVNALSLFFCGFLFPWRTLYEPFKAIHHIVPLFYVQTANNVLVYTNLHAGCGPLEYPGQCTDGQGVMDFLQIPLYSSLAAQGVCAVYVLLFAAVLLAGAMPHRTAALKDALAHTFRWRRAGRKIVKDDIAAAPDGLSWDHDFEPVTSMEEITVRIQEASVRRPAARNARGGDDDGGVVVLADAASTASTSSDSRCAI